MHMAIVKLTKTGGSVAAYNTRYIASVEAKDATTSKIVALGHELATFSFEVEGSFDEVTKAINDAENMHHKCSARNWAPSQR